MQGNARTLVPLLLIAAVAAWTMLRYGGGDGLPAEDTVAASGAPLQEGAAPAEVSDPEIIDRQGYRALLERHRGKPLMVNFWATWCEPCREEYPMVNELAREFAPRGLVVVGVSLDDDAEINLVRRFLGRMKPVFPNYRKKPGNEEAFINAVDPRWRGAIPATFFYKPDGSLVSNLVGEHKRPAFEKAIREIVPR